MNECPTIHKMSTPAPRGTHGRQGICAVTVVPTYMRSMWAAVPVTNSGSGRREAQMVKEYADIPPESERVIFFPRASGG